MKWRLPGSLTWRLAALFALVAAFTLTLVGAYLYRSLAAQLELRDDEELIGKVVQTRHLLEKIDSPGQIEKGPEPFLNAVFGHEGLLFMVTDPNGRTLVQNAQWSERPPSVPLVAPDREPTLEDVRSWKTSDGPVRLVVARGALRGSEVHIFLARDASARRALIAAYLLDLSLAGSAGTLLAALLGYVTVRHGLRPIGAVAQKADEITSRRLDTRLMLEEAPTELRQLTAAFNGMLDRLEDGVKRLRGFAGDLAHDLRTPLNTLMVKTEVGLSRPRTADEYHAILVSNMDEYERISRLIENTLFLARADNAQLAMHSERVDLEKTLQKIGDYFSGLAEDAGIAYSVSGEGTVSADPVLLDRAVSNLIANAIRHTGRGGSVGVLASEDEQAIRISVENSGRDISPEHVARLFDPYFRGDISRADSGGAAGLGLSIVKAIMKLHGGSAEVASGGGTTRFVLIFPRLGRT